VLQLLKSVIKLSIPKLASRLCISLLQNLSQSSFKCEHEPGRLCPNLLGLINFSL
jgi:hypothetical protein